MWAKITTLLSAAAVAVLPLTGVLGNTSPDVATQREEVKERIISAIATKDGWELRKHIPYQEPSKYKWVGDSLSTSKKGVKAYWDISPADFLELSKWHSVEDAQYIWELYAILYDLDSSNVDMEVLEELFEMWIFAINKYSIGEMFDWVIDPKNIADAVKKNKPLAKVLGYNTWKDKFARLNEEIRENAAQRWENAAQRLKNAAQKVKINKDADILSRLDAITQRLWWETVE